ncbi:cyclin, N-terminal domain-containing protein [Cryptosporidium muris RN66]|uniref:Cyclin, N-terminal domain-containing protein n=1 Tax=Cryptosporidium muris (strain RN66) TaxID=441375 RepID=B6AI78_CRYMR|nr:cyclin, N-terminal domain-containing protein [Cryptosporidium muris RN66]EEA07919.1 cyclin, N-terminal domain-containing protein [Cryptosporidium muris RN66]|eukprot:XP_002142268.1 cyclin, N-terminal domain-containing protein [Cryptosporidium muris RN66]
MDVLVNSRETLCSVEFNINGGNKLENTSNNNLFKSVTYRVKGFLFSFSEISSSELKENNSSFYEIEEGNIEPLLYKISKFNYNLNIYTNFKFIYLLEIDDLMNFTKSYGESQSYYRSHKFGVIERSKVINWLSTYCDRLNFQSCTFHLSCSILNKYLIKTKRCLDNSSLVECTSASLLLASNVIETISDGIVPSLKQFSDAAKWLHRSTIVEKQIDILTTITDSFNITETPLQMFILYISKIYHHEELKYIFSYTLNYKYIKNIIKWCLLICDYLVFTEIPTNNLGQDLLPLLPAFILWIGINRDRSVFYKEYSSEKLEKLYFKDVCSYEKLDSHLIQHICKLLNKVANQVSKYWLKRSKYLNLIKEDAINNFSIKHSYISFELIGNA